MRWVVVVVVAAAVSVLLRLIAYRGTERGVSRLAHARRALGLGPSGPQDPGSRADGATAG